MENIELRVTHKTLLMVGSETFPSVNDRNSLGAASTSAEKGEVNKLN